MPIQSAGKAVFRGLRMLLAFTALTPAAAVAISSETENAVANGDTRTLNLYHVHTHETASITFRVNGVYDTSALEKLNWMLRDWRRNEPTKMDPRLFDVMWEVYHESGSRQPIWIMCGYRSPETNAMLRRRSRAVAEYSQHMLGKAMDVHFADMSMQKIRDIAMRLQSGGVGYYPTSGTPFVHIDVGGVRYWPRMSYEEMARIFPDGKTVDIPANGRPLPGYDIALANIKARGGEAFSASTSSSGGGGLFSALFGHGEDADSAPPQARDDRWHAPSTQVAANTTTTNDATPARPDRAAALRWSAAPIANDAAPAPDPNDTSVAANDEPLIPLPTPRPADLASIDLDPSGLAEVPLPPERPGDLVAALPAVPDKKPPLAVAMAAPAPRTTVVESTPRLTVSAQPDGADAPIAGAAPAALRVASADDSMPLLSTASQKRVPLPSMITEGTSSKAQADSSVLAFASTSLDEPALSPAPAKPFKPRVAVASPLKKILRREPGELVAARIDRSNFHVLTASAPTERATSQSSLGTGSSVTPLRAGLQRNVEAVMFGDVPTMTLRFRPDDTADLASDHFEGAAVHFLSEADGVDISPEVQVSDAGK